MIIHDRDGMTITITPEWHSKSVRVDLGHRTESLRMELGEAEKFVALVQEEVRRVREFQERVGNHISQHRVKDSHDPH